MSPEEIDTFFTILSTENPSPETELNYEDSFTLLIAVVLSAQATDISVNKATDKLYRKAKTPANILKLGEEGLKKYIQTIGLYNSKAKNVIKLCQLLLDEHAGQVPETREELEKLPGVGRKTANVILNVAFGQPTIAVDTHLFRLGNRTGMGPGKTPLDVEKKLEKRIPKKWLLHAHHWLILHGRYVCKARKPDCNSCKVFDVCGFKDKVLYAKGLTPAKKPATTRSRKKAATKTEKKREQDH